jgi:L-Ala-D/L-Glu epimerase
MGFFVFSANKFAITGSNKFANTFKTIQFMNLSFQPLDLALRYPFRIALMSRTSTPIVLTQLQLGNFTGQGEASMPPYLGESPASVCAFLELAHREILSKMDDSEAIQNIDCQSIMSKIDALAKGNKAAKASIDIALHDLKGQLENQPVWQILGSNPDKMPLTTCTIGIEMDPSVLKQKIDDAADFEVLKIKLGSEDDKKLVQLVRQFTDKPLYVDANQGWQDVNFAIDMTHWLAEKGVLLIEQPMLKSDLEGNGKVCEASPLPVFADESFQRLSDFDAIKGVFDGINIKLMKSTGLWEAKKMVEKARHNGLKIMIGCMSETSCAILAAAALAPQCDYADLDGPWLIKNNPFLPPILRGGKIQLSMAAGLGISEK